MNDSTRDIDLLSQASVGDNVALGTLISRHRARLQRIVRARLDKRLKHRIDASDVIQEACVEAANRFQEYVDGGCQIPFFLWLRFITRQKILQLHRHHFQVQGRAVSREVPAAHDGIGSEQLARHVISQLTSPSQRVIREEDRLRLHRAIEDMDDIDREILVLRHFEQLSLKETAQVLDISHPAACNRWGRALTRLRRILAEDNSGAIRG